MLALTTVKEFTGLVTSNPWRGRLDRSGATGTKETAAFFQEARVGHDAVGHLSRTQESSFGPGGLQRKEAAEEGSLWLRAGIDIARIH